LIQKQHKIIGIGFEMYGPPYSSNWQPQQITEPAHSEPAQMRRPKLTID